MVLLSLFDGIGTARLGRPPLGSPRSRTPWQAKSTSDGGRSRALHGRCGMSALPVMSGVSSTAERNP